MKEIFKKIIAKESECIIGILVVITIILSCTVFCLKLKLDNTVEITKLHDCYMCGKEVEILPVNESYYIECEVLKGGCGMRTGYYFSKKSLAEKWNSIGE